MSRSYRGAIFQPRWGLSTVRSTKKPVFTEEEEVAYLNRIVKRANKAAGYDTGPKPDIWEYYVECNGKERTGRIDAHTRGEARGAVKRILGISRRKRLPYNIILERANVKDQ